MPATPTAHATCDHPATKSARAACRKARAAEALADLPLGATILDSDRPTMRNGQILFCALCAEDLAPRRFRRVSDLRQIDCPCGRRWDDGAAYGARLVEDIR